MTIKEAQKLIKLIRTISSTFIGKSRYKDLVLVLCNEHEKLLNILQEQAKK
jgi:hypothetical protein